MSRAHRRTGLTLAAVLALALSAGASPSPAGRGGQKSPEVPSILREIREEVLGLGRYPGEDFARGEFFLGEGDDDTNKTHAVGILVQDGPGGSRMTIVVSRLEPARDNPRVKYTREPRTIACRIDGEAVEMLRSDYSPPELEKLLPIVLKAVLDKKALLLRRRGSSPRRSPSVEGGPTRWGEPDDWFPGDRGARGDSRAKPGRGSPGTISP